MKLIEILSRHTPSDLNTLRHKIAAAMRMLSVEETVPDQDIQEVRAAIANLPKEINVFRLLGVDDPSKIKQHLGNHWTLDWDALVHNGNFYLPKGKKQFYLHARASSTDINLPMTIAYRYLFPEEQEVFFDSGTDIYLMGVYEYPDGERPLADENGRFLMWGVHGHT